MSIDITCIVKRYAYTLEATGPTWPCNNILLKFTPLSLSFICLSFFKEK
jgi:hypothetical protein